MIKKYIDSIKNDKKVYYNYTVGLKNYNNYMHGMIMSIFMILLLNKLMAT